MTVLYMVVSAITQPMRRLSNQSACRRPCYNAMLSVGRRRRRMQEPRTQGGSVYFVLASSFRSSSRNAPSVSILASWFFSTVSPFASFSLRSSIALNCQMS